MRSCGLATEHLISMQLVEFLDSVGNCPLFTMDFFVIVLLSILHTHQVARSCFYVLIHRILLYSVYQPTKALKNDKMKLIRYNSLLSTELVRWTCVPLLGWHSGAADILSG